MSRSDASLFHESLKMWDRPEEELSNRGTVPMDETVERMVDDMFERFCNLDMDLPQPFVGNC
jgi:hypothetical protein